MNKVPIKPPLNSTHPKSRAAWRKWVEKNHTRTEGVWLVSYKKATGKSRFDYAEAVEEALCFGWIDSKGNKLDDDPNVWGWRSGKPPGKDDINHSMVFITQDPSTGHIWVLVSGDRLSTNGTSYLDMEFYQNDIFQNNGTAGQPPVVGSTGGFNTTGPHGGRTVGDLDVTLSYVGGGSVATISFLQWAPNAEGGGYDSS